MQIAKMQLTKMLLAKMQLIKWSGIKLMILVFTPKELCIKAQGCEALRATLGY